MPNDSMTAEIPTPSNLGPYQTLRKEAFDKSSSNQIQAAEKLKQVVRDANIIVDTLVPAEVKRALKELPQKKLQDPVAVKEALRDQAKSHSLTQDVQKEIQARLAHPTPESQEALARLGPEEERLALLTDFVATQIEMAKTEYAPTGARVTVRKMEGEGAVQVSKLIDQLSAREAPTPPQQAPRVDLTPESVEALADRLESQTQKGDVLRSAAELTAAGAAIMDEFGEIKKPSIEDTQPNPAVRRSEAAARQAETEYSKLSVRELQRRIEGSALGSPELVALRAEKQKRVYEMADNYEKRTTRPFEAHLEERLKDAITAATPASYVEIIDKNASQPVSLFDNDEMNRLYAIVVRDEANRVLQKLYDGAKDSHDPPVNKADQFSVDSINLRVAQSRVNAGVDIENPIDLLASIPPTFAEWQAAFPWYSKDTGIYNAVANYYRQHEVPPRGTNPDQMSTLMERLNAMATGRMPYDSEASLRFGAGNLGISEEELAMFKSGNKDNLSEWFKEQLVGYEDAIDSSKAKERILFAVNAVYVLRGRENEKLYADIFKMVKDEFLFSDYFSMFKNASEGFEGKFASLAEAGDKVFGGKEGVERFMRFWEESFDTMAKLESNRTVLRSYLDAFNLTEEEAAVKQIANLRFGQAEEKQNKTIRRHLRFWRVIGRQAYWDAYMPPKFKNPDDRDDGKENTDLWYGIRRFDSADKDLARLMNLPVWAAKNRVGNINLRMAVDTGYRDLLSFMLPESVLKQMGVERNHLAIQNIASLKDFDLTKYGHKGEVTIYKRWIEGAEKAYGLAKDLKDWMDEPNVEKFKKIYGQYKFLIGSGYEKHEVVGSVIGIGWRGKYKLAAWEIKALGVAKATIQYLSEDAPGKLRLNPFDRDRAVRDMIEGRSTDVSDRGKEQAIIDYVYPPIRRSRDTIFGMIFRAIGYGAGQIASGGGGKK